MNIGGAETFIYSVLSKINTDKYHIDFILQSHNNKNTKLMDLCHEKDSKIYYIDAFHKSPIKSILQTKSIIKRGDYDLIHIHQNAMINVGPIIAGKRCKIPVILHSHNSLSNAGTIGKVLHTINRKYYASKVIRLACGEEAGKWMYGDLDYKVVSNAIPLERYRYSEAYREEIRKRHGIQNNTKVIGHIGRFVPAKNHERIVDIFKSIASTDENVTLMLVGDGDLKPIIENKVINDLLKNRVVFAGNVDDAYKYYSAFDVLLFPSLFEGLPFTLVEAQASGLKCLVSDNVTKDVKVTSCIEYLELNKSEKVWKDALITCLQESYNRYEMSKDMIGSVYDVKQMIIEVENIYDEIGEGVQIR